MNEKHKVPTFIQGACRAYIVLVIAVSLIGVSSLGED